METTSPTLGYSATVTRASCSGRTRSLQKRCEYSRTMSWTCKAMTQTRYNNTRSERHRGTYPIATL